VYIIICSVLTAGSLSVYYLFKKELSLFKYGIQPAAPIFGAAGFYACILIILWYNKNEYASGFTKYYKNFPK